MAVEILITESAIRDRVVELGRRIEGEYSGKPLTIVAVLTGSLILLADLVRQIGIPHRIALLQASSYRGATTTSTTPLGSCMLIGPTSSGCTSPCGSSLPTPIP